MKRRDEIAAKLTTEGKRRERARAEAKAATAEIRKLAPRALKAGMPKRDVARLARVSRPALDELLKQ
jgi:hypothetical protein